MVRSLEGLCSLRCLHYKRCLLGFQGSWGTVLSDPHSTVGLCGNRGSWELYDRPLGDESLLGLGLFWGCR